MMSSITPTLHGDIKTGQHTFLMAPVCAEDLHNSRSARNFWVYIHGHGAWSASGNSSRQLAQRFSGVEDEVIMEGGFLWHKVTRVSSQLGVTAEITNFVPATDDRVELMRVTIRNTGDRLLAITPTAAIPLYCRSAENIRDHRHVTSLLHRIWTVPWGVVVRPTLRFDERGHRPNSVVYGVLGAEEDGEPPVGFFPVLGDFIGEGGCLEWPQVIVENLGSRHHAGERLEGYEAIGALRFRDVVLTPGSCRSYVLAMAVCDTGGGNARGIEAARRNTGESDTGESDAGKSGAGESPGSGAWPLAAISAIAEKYCSGWKFERHLEESKAYWKRKLDRLVIEEHDPDFKPWMRWVTLQPMLRRIYGCSFLPHHDYGKGGRGWRDLWQDCLALLILEPEKARDLVLNSFAGVRIDGSNATIIGAGPGEFTADRNSIPRVWMDHGAWPLLATKLYIDLSGDIQSLLLERPYFRDGQLNRARKRDPLWKPEDGFALKQHDGNPYLGSIVEHILIQHLTSFLNVGEHNMVRLEGADWNDALDMARERGESVAFTALYGSNLSDIAMLLRELSRRARVREIPLAAEMTMLLDTIFDPIDYDSVREKRALLQSYLDACENGITGRKVNVGLDAIARDLERKAVWIRERIREKEWITSAEGFRWFNGYYDNDGKRVEGDHPGGVRMTLTGQVFTIMGGAATDEQVEQVVSAVERYLKDPVLGGYRLNTDFRGAQPKMGRCFGFAYGHKENGAMFNHMVVMYANALYKRGFVKEGHAVLRSIYRLCRNFTVSRVYPGLPEYFDARGRGMYHYLTGSASWLVFTMVNEVYGVKGRIGDLVIEPKLVAEEFTAPGTAGVRLVFAGRKLHVTYRNPLGLSYGEYGIERITVDGREVGFERLDGGRSALVRRAVVADLEPDSEHELEVDLG